MKTTLRYISALLILCITFIHAETTWTTGAYDNNQHLKQTLTVLDAEKITVTLKGETEAWRDIVWFTDENGDTIPVTLKSGRTSSYLSGVFDETFTVEGSSITAHLRTGESVTKSGITVTVKSKSAEETTATPVPTPTRTQTATATWTTGAYDNNQNLKQTLTVADAEKIIVTLKGETEAWKDMVWFTDSEGNDISLTRSSGETGLYLSGVLEETFILDGASVIVNFSSNESITKSGVRVSVKKYSDETQNTFEIINEDISDDNSDGKEHKTTLYVTKADTGERVELESDNYGYTASTGSEFISPILYTSNSYYAVHRNPGTDGGERVLYFGKYDENTIDRSWIEHEAPEAHLRFGTKTNSLENENGLYLEITHQYGVSKDCLYFNGSVVTEETMVSPLGFGKSLVLENHNTACGLNGKFSPSDSTAMIEKIKNYAEDSNNPTPTMDDYKLITSITEENIEQVNAAVVDASKEDVDSIIKILTVATSTDICITRHDLDSMIRYEVDVSGVNTGCITNMSKLFENNKAFNQDLSNWDISSVTNMSSMFNGATAFTNQDLSSWDVSKVESHDRFLSGAGTGNTEPNWR